MCRRYKCYIFGTECTEGVDGAEGAEGIKYDICQKHIFVAQYLIALNLFMSSNSLSTKLICGHFNKQNIRNFKLKYFVIIDLY